MCCGRLTGASGRRPRPDGIRPGFEVPDEALMALAFDGSTAVSRGMINYPVAFGV